MQSVVIVIEEDKAAEGHEAFSIPVAEESRSIGMTDWPDIVQGLGYLVAE